MSSSLVRLLLSVNESDEEGEEGTRRSTQVDCEEDKRMTTTTERLKRSRRRRTLEELETEEEERAEAEASLRFSCGSRKEVQRLTKKKKHQKKKREDKEWEVSGRRRRENTSLSCRPFFFFQTNL